LAAAGIPSFTLYALRRRRIAETGQLRAVRLSLLWTGLLSAIFLYAGWLLLAVPANPYLMVPLLLVASLWVATRVIGGLSHLPVDGHSPSVGPDAEEPSGSGRSRDSEDPGWRPILKRPLTMVPGLSLFSLRDRSRENAIVGLRSMFVRLAVSLWLFALILLFVVPGDRWWATDTNAWFLAVVLGMGLLGNLVLRAGRRRRLDTTSPRKLAASFLARTFINFGLAESIALVGFAGAFVMDALWIYLVGLAFATIGFMSFGPTKRELDRRQRQIEEQGSQLSLLGALGTALAPGWRRQAPGTQPPPAP
jgi:hypothetical protein